MERKLATVLFADLVDSTALVAAADPEIVRRRLSRFFDSASEAIEAHGGKVEKFAGDAVMAAFGVPLVHEDDAVRALKAALAIRDSVEDLGFEVRLGVEAGEVVADASGEVASTFVTGTAVNTAARLQQLAGPGEIVAGPVARGLADRAIEFAPLGGKKLKGLAERELWRVIASAESEPESSSPFVGREAELELLENVYARVAKARRPHLVTVYGDPGVGKSRLIREFVAGAEGATVLFGRTLPYGEGVTYWPLAEMLKAVAQVRDDDPSEEAFEKIQSCCADEAVADLLGLATGVLSAVDEERAPSEIAWAAREFAEGMAEAGPLILVFEDIHWAEEPLLELIAALTTIEEAPLLVLALARADLLDRVPNWGGGQPRALTLELEALDERESRELAEALLPAADLTHLLERTEGNPLFIEEMARLLAECPDGSGGVPETLQALIEARIDRLPAADRHLVRVAAVIGRTFWTSALEELAGVAASDLAGLEARDFVHRAERSSLRGETAYRFKHALIREVAYAGLSKSTRAELHELFAGWLERKAGEELLEIRAYHLARATTLSAELDGRAPKELTARAAKALTSAGDRALAREANESARKMLSRALELEPSLERRYKAALAAVRLTDLPTVEVEMERVLEEAEAAGDRHYAGRALARLAEVALLRYGDLERTFIVSERALEYLPEPDAARFAALQVRSNIGWWRGDLDDHGRHMREALEVARQIGREDLEAQAAHELALDYRYRGEPEEAAPLVSRALELADRSGSASARGHALHSAASLHLINGELDKAASSWREAAGLFADVGDRWMRARSLQGLGAVEARLGLCEEAERELREAISLLESVEDRGALCESQRGLAQVLAARGHLEEADRYARLACQTVTAADVASQATTKSALAIVRARQGQRDKAESLFLEALQSLKATQIAWVTLEVATAYDVFLQEEGRHYPIVESLSQDGRLYPSGFAAVGLPLSAPVPV